MDRRQRKTKLAVFHAFTALLAEKDYNQITVGEIIQKADIGRATFYAHFETKDYLMKAFCQELFCHIFDIDKHDYDHHHIFECDGADSVFLHLFQHFQKNDNNILALLSSQNNQLFLSYFRANLDELIESQLPYFASRKPPELPASFWKNHIAASFVETLNWWISRDMKESAETIADYFLQVI